MSIFPQLKTGAVAQYPLVRSTRYSTQAVRFLDGSRQRFSLYPAGVRRWTVQLAGLDETELAAVISFVEDTGGGTFSFPDPVSGTMIAACRIAGDQFAAGMGREGAGEAALVVEEVV